MGAESTGLLATVNSALTWPLPGVSISSARQPIGEDLGGAAYPCVAPACADATAAAGLADGIAGESGRFGEEGTAFLIEVAGKDVDDIDQPTGQRAECLRAGADAPVEDCPRRVGEVARQLANGLGIDAAAMGDRLGRELHDRGFQFGEACYMLSDAAQAHALLGEQCLDDA